jgi:hypothetical protein
MAKGIGAMLAKEQKDAFNSAKRVVSVIKYGRYQYKIRYPWRDIDGPTTETSGSYNYIAARQRCAEYIAFYAMRILGYDSETAKWAIGEYPTGGADKIYRDALTKAGPVEIG